MLNFSCKQIGEVLCVGLVLISSFGTSHVSVLNLSSVDAAGSLAVRDDDGLFDPSDPFLYNAVADALKRLKVIFASHPTFKFAISGSLDLNHQYPERNKRIKDIDITLCHHNLPDSDIKNFKAWLYTSFVCNDPNHQYTMESTGIEDSLRIRLGDKSTYIDFNIAPADDTMRIVDSWTLPDLVTLPDDLSGQSIRNIESFWQPKPVLFTAYCGTIPVLAVRNDPASDRKRENIKSDMEMMGSKVRVSDQQRALIIEIYMGLRTMIRQQQGRLSFLNDMTAILAPYTKMDWSPDPPMRI